jgi:hypothetical protein
MTRAATVETHGHGGEHSGLRGTPAFFPNEQARGCLVRLREARETVHAALERP